MSSVSSILFSTLLAVLLVSLARGQVASLVPDGLLDFIPAACMPSLETSVLPCAIENLCFSLLPTDEEIAAIPAESEIQSCVDVEVALCPITGRCTPCRELANDFFKCIILNADDGSISETVADLVNGCSLDCTSTPEPVIAVLPEVEAPVPAPTEAPASSDVPTDGPETADATEAPVESGAVGMMTTTVAIVCGVVSFMTL